MRTRVLALLAAIFLVATAIPAHAAANIERLAGDDRYETAVAVNCCNPDGTQRSFGTVVLASGVHFTDALVGNFLAGLDSGILFLTDGESLTQDAIDLVENANDATIANVYVMGGKDAVAESAVNDLSEAMANSGNQAAIHRVAGSDAIGTAVAAAELRSEDIRGVAEGTKYAIVAAVGGFADSLAAAPLAYSSSFPILYTHPDDLPDETAEFLDTFGITNVLIVGGTAAVSNAVASEISDLDITVQRLAGPTRQETSVHVAEYVIGADAEFDGREFAIARGDQFADALSGGSHAGFVGAPILLTHSSTQLGPAATGFLQRQSGTLERGWAYGGTGALSDGVLAEARKATAGP